MSNTWQPKNTLPTDQDNMKVIASLRYMIALSIISLPLLLSTPLAAENASNSRDSIPNSQLTEFDAAYKVRASIASGELSMSLSAASDGAYLFRTLTRPRGLVRVFARGEIDEQSKVIYKDSTVIPLDYVLRDTISKDHDADYTFDWAGGVVTGVERGESASGELQPGMLNRAALYVALMQDLKSGRVPEEYVLFDRGRIKSYEIENLGNEIIEVPFGRFETLRLVRDSDDSRRSMYLWCAPALDYLPVRIELYKGDKRVSVAELKAVTGLPASKISN